MGADSRPESLRRAWRSRDTWAWRGSAGGSPRPGGPAGRGAGARAAKLKPDVVVLDISMPGESGLQVAARLRDSSPEPRVLILSMHDNAEYVLESVRAGAHGYLLKDTAATELRNAILTVVG